MKAYLSTHLAVALHALIIALVIATASWYVSYSRAHVEAQLTERIDNTVLRIITLAETTDRNGADALTERIITDCQRRPEFETLLNGLGTASRKDLLRAQQLFESCGSFYAERKSLMVAQLEREYALLDDDLALLTTVRDLTPKELALQRWEGLIALENDRSTYLNDQTALQSNIITLLIEGGQAAKITELAAQAQNVAQSLAITDAQIDTLRSNLVP